MTDKEKTLDDLEGWKKLFTTSSSMGSTYAAFLSPDKTKLAQVHLEDREITLIFNRETKKIEYIHPTTLEGMKAVGATIETLEASMMNVSEGLKTMTKGNSQR